MTYQSGAAFRRALEQRLLTRSREQQLPLVRLRKAVAFERFIARLVRAQPGCWLLKGGFALQLRLGITARTTLDLDVGLLTPTDTLHRQLMQAAGLDLGDWFTYSVAQAGTRSPGEAHGGLRFGVTAMLDGRIFERFHLDVGIGDPVVDEAETLTIPQHLAFAGIDAVTVPCYPVTQHLAEKTHAYAQPRRTGANTRVKDLIDILLIAGRIPVNAAGLRAALAATFAARDDGARPPAALPEPPGAWASTFGRMAREVGLQYRSLPEAYTEAAAFLGPVLRNDTVGTWDPETHSWTTLP